MYSIDDIKFKILPVAKQYGVEKVALFGSYARGEQTDKSDLDFLIDKGKIKGLFQFFGFVGDLEEALGLPVDVMCYSQLPKSMIEEDVIKDEVVLYEQAG